MALTRKQHWAEQAFHEFLLTRARMPFRWGENDCALFAADAIEAVTGTDVAADFRGKYTDAAGAFATINSVTGGMTVADAAVYCAEKFGMVEWTHPLKAQRGDLVTLEDAGRRIAGVIGLNGHIVAVGEAGLKQIPITAVGKAWQY